MSFFLNKTFLVSAIAVSAILSFSSHRNQEIPEKMQTTQSFTFAPKTTDTSTSQPEITPITEPKTTNEQSIVPTQKISVITKTTTSEQVYYPVIKVVDGDTLTIQMNGKSQTLRLIGLDTPETVDPRKPVQCFGIEASNKAKNVLTGQKVLIETDPSQDTYDKYNRLLVYVFLQDGTLFNKTMISEGFGHEYTYNTPYKYQSEFKIAENEARIQKKGLWADGVCEQPNITPITKTTTVSPAPTIPTPPSTTSSYICTSDVYNCSYFKTHAEAQAVYEACGGASHDVHRLDADKDGEACESLP
jgi:endonuclease YncB( thermonuclease family)